MGWFRRHQARATQRAIRGNTAATARQVWLGNVQRQREFELLHPELAFVGGWRPGVYPNSTSRTGYRHWDGQQWGRPWYPVEARRAARQAWIERWFG